MRCGMSRLPGEEIEMLRSILESWTGNGRREKHRDTYQRKTL